MPLRIHTKTPPAPGTKLTASGENAAEVTSAEFSPALGEVVAFAYVRSEPAHAKQQLAIAGSNPLVTATLI
jgi:glycine cleavage system aminomethyltransferase T